jgi:hypothetical protein
LWGHVPSLPWKVLLHEHDNRSWATLQLKSQQVHLEVLERCSFWISTRTLNVLTEVFGDFPKSIQGYCVMAPNLAQFINELISVSVAIVMPILRSDLYQLVVCRRLMLCHLLCLEQFHVSYPSFWFRQLASVLCAAVVMNGAVFCLILLLGLFFDPKVGDTVFLWNMCWLLRD